MKIMYTIYNHRDAEKYVCHTIENVNKYLDKIGHSQYSVTSTNKDGEQYEFLQTLTNKDKKDK